MKSKIPCEMVRDLFPSYLDGLTSEVTNREIDGHLEECGDCRQVLDNMRDPKNLFENILGDDEKKEIDFLRKLRRRRIKWIVLGSLIVLAFLLTGILLRRSLYGYTLDNSLEGDMISCEAKVNGRDIEISGAILDENYGMARSVGMGKGLWVSDGEIYSYEVKDGVMYVPADTVTHKKLGGDILYQKFNQSHEFDGRTFHEIWVKDKIIWSNGETILPRTAAVYRERHDYIGDAVADGRLTDALGLNRILKRYGGHTVELQTKAEPYGWTFHLKNNLREVSGEDEKELRAYGFVLLAAVGNLSKVNFDFSQNDTENIITVTKEEAEKFATENMGEKVNDIHEIGKDAGKLQKLLEVTNILDTAYPARRIGAGDEIHIHLADSTDYSFIKEVRLQIQENDFTVKKTLTKEVTWISDSLTSGYYDFIIQRRDLEGVDLGKPVYLTFSVLDANHGDFRSVSQGVRLEDQKNGHIKIMPQFGDFYGFRLKEPEEEKFEIVQ